MKAKTKKAMGCSARAGTFAAESDGTGGSEQVKVAIEKGPRRRLPSTLGGSGALSYADMGFFFVFVFFQSMMFRIGVHLHALSQTKLHNPAFPLQITISLSLIGSLYEIIWLWHGLIAHVVTSTTHVIHFWNLILLDALLGPIIEESLFRGCLLPVGSRTTGPTIGIEATAVVFATLHPISTFMQWICFVATGIASGCIRVKSASTAAPTLMHPIYNATLFLCQGL